jgi:hypothetical protein
MKFLKVILPPLIGFALYFLMVRYSGVYFNLQIGDIGEGTVEGFMAYYRYSLPLLLVVGMLTQLLIVLPLWERARRYQSSIAKVADMIGLLFICVLFAAGISYMISDPMHNFHLFVNTALFMTAVQVGYWIVNFLILFLLGPRLKKAKDDTAKDTNDAE